MTSSDFEPRLWRARRSTLPRAPNLFATAERIKPWRRSAEALKRRF